MKPLAAIALLPVLAGLVFGASGPPPARRANLLVDGLPILREWTPAAMPPAGTPPGSAVVRIIVAQDGVVTSARVLSASDARSGEAAVEAVKQWIFSPALELSRPVSMCLDVPFDFSAKQTQPTPLSPPHQQPRPAPRSPASVRDTPIGEFPASLRERGLPGVVRFVCKVGADGRATGLRVVAASHADYVAAALAASSRWQFNPAKQGDLSVAAEFAGHILYEDNVRNPAAILAANGITALDGSPPEQRPTPRVVADPIWPYDLLLKGEVGSASAEFTVDGQGRVLDVKVRDATDPAFGQALVAALNTWSFNPAMDEGRGVEVRLLKRAEFKPVPADDPLGRVVALARQSAIPSATGLDEKLISLYRVGPEVPDALRGGGTGYNAVIEFVIDREGRVRLPRIVSASREDLGWSAATAVAQWLFKAPARDGQPTEVKVQIPFIF